MSALGGGLLTSKRHTNWVSAGFVALALNILSALVSSVSRRPKLTFTVSDTCQVRATKADWLSLSTSPQAGVAQTPLVRGLPPLEVELSSAVSSNQYRPTIQSSLSSKAVPDSCHSMESCSLMFSSGRVNQLSGRVEPSTSDMYSESSSR